MKAMKGMREFMETAGEAARIGGEVIRAHRGRRPAEVRDKGTNDFVTEVDRAAERAVVDFLRSRHPDHTIVAEEGQGQEGDGGYRWIVDPLDGTTNFIHDFPSFATSVGLWSDGEGIAGAVFDPVRDEMFRAARGEGAWLGERRIHVSGATGLDGTLLATGFPFRRPERIPSYLRSFGELLGRTAGVRRAGSAALDLCYTACGRLDGFWEMGLAAWDLAAGVVLVREAGGTVTDYAGGDRFMESGNVIAAANGVHAPVLEVLRRHHDLPS
jgi:myo-inositol-1(or 4)-monophosphatase